MTYSYKHFCSLLVCLTLACSTYGETIYVKANATGANDGKSWSDAFNSLADALQEAENGEEIWVAAGTYYPTAATNRNISFDIPSGVKILGGFPNTGNPGLANRNPNANVSTLSGDIDQNGNLSNNSYTVIYTKDVNANTILDGFTITGGNADGTFTVDFPILIENGGAAWVNEASNFEDSNPTIKNCKFIGNNAINRGGAMYHKAPSSGDASYILENCLFQNNTAGKDGGAIFNAQSGSGSTCNPSVTNTNFINNTAGEAGGAIFNNAAFFGEVSGTYSNCNFTNNEATTSEGGAVYNNGFFQGTSSPYFTDCNFVGNHSVVGSGGAIYSDASGNGECDYRLTSCLFENNTSVVYGGAICNIISNNGEIKPIYTNCVFKENYSANGGATYSRGAFGSNLDVIVANCVFYKNDAGVGGTIYQNEAGGTSLVTTKVSNSIFEQNTAGFSPIFHLTGPATIGVNHTIFDVNTCLDLVMGDGTSEADCNGGNKFNQDPLFVNAAGGDFHVLANSPAVDAGNNADVPNFVTTDADGNPRIAGGLVDMGIYERVNATSDVDGDGILDINDNCPLIANTNQADGDGDGAGTVCDCDDTPATGTSCSEGCTTFYLDNDGDGFGNPAIAQTTCVAPTGYVANNQDFNDNDDTLYPNAPELCDGKDNNNNGEIDEGTDDDNDGVCNEDDICPGGDDTIDLNNNGIPDDCESLITLNCPTDITVNADAGQNTATVNWTEPTGSTDCNGGGTGGGSCSGATIPKFTYKGEFNGSEYYLSDSAAIWSDAQTIAVANGGNIVAINSQAENDYVKGSIGNNIIHIGLTDEQTEGTYEWINGDAANYLNFEGTPSGEDYGEMYFWNGKWGMNGDYTKPYLIEVPCGGGTGGGLMINQTAGPDNGGAFPIGTTQVEYTATDDCGGLKTCTFNVTVSQGTSNVSLTCPSDIVMNAAPGATSKVVNYSAPVGNTTCATNGVTITLENGLASGAAFPLGTTVVEYKGTDQCGSMDVCSFNVTINSVGSDISLNCPADITESVNAAGETVAVTWNDPTGGSNCGSGGYNFTQTAGPAKGSQFGVGSTTITYTATDNCGGSISCSFTITVNLSSTDITLNCPSNINLNVPQGSGGGVATWSMPTATTDCTTGGGGSCSGSPKAGFNFIGEFNGSDYYISQGKAPWETAKANCETAGGTLAAIENQAENDHIKSIVGGEIMHIGMTDMTTEGSPVWLNGEPTNFMNFSGFNANSAGFDYTVFYHWDGSWDWADNSAWRYYILEIKCGGPSNSVPVITQTAGAPSGSTFPVGSTTISYQATDDCGNLTTCSFNINVTESAVTCNPDTDGGQISGNELICDPYDPQTITSTSLPTGGSGAIEYVWLQSTSGCPTNIGQAIANSNSATYNPPFITTTTHYMRWSRRANCTDWVASNCITKTVDDCGTGNSYCDLSAEQPWQEWISKVELADLSNPSAKSLGYQDYTNLVANLTAGQQYTVSVELAFSYNQWDENVYVWMDFNQDNDFTDPGELVLEQLSPSNGNGGAQPHILTQTFTVPASAINGNTRMRVAMKREAGANPCDAAGDGYVHGEVEDYTLNISAGASNRAAPVLAFEAYPVTGNSVLEWFSNTTDLENNFEVERSLDNLTFEVIEEVSVTYENDYDSFYKLMDRQPALGENYYRIKQVFKDGETVYTPTKKLVFGNTNIDLHFYPNPAKEVLFVDLKNHRGTSGNIQIINMLGQVMENIKLENIDNNTLEISLDKLDNGMHTLLFNVKGKPIMSEKLVVEKFR